MINCRLAVWPHFVAFPDATSCYTQKCNLHSQNDDNFSQSDLSALTRSQVEQSSEKLLQAFQAKRSICRGFEINYNRKQAVSVV